ncbi:antibiotic biosynthesis monooxygenase [Pseudacidovorax sp. 1753]|uniref:putative quinol monooxygenase n=1 Tax=Pseudacidovorax sp. 1753 TaxID=3156419 RepID=UPI00339AF1F6
MIGLREEAGTLVFDLLLASDTPHRILLYEVYEDRAAFYIHLDGSSMVIFRQQTMDQIKDMAGGGRQFGIG